MVRRLTGAVVALCVAAGAAQAMTCTFEAECFEADGCNESAFALAVAAAPEEESGLVFETEFGDLDVVWSHEEPGRFVGLAEGAGARYLLSTSEKGSRLSVHLEGPIAVTYIGKCEGGF